MRQGVANKSLTAIGNYLNPSSLGLEGTNNNVSLDTNSNKAKDAMSIIERAHSTHNTKYFDNGFGANVQKHGFPPKLTKFDNKTGRRMPSSVENQRKRKVSVSAVKYLLINYFFSCTGRVSSSLHNASFDNYWLTWPRH